MYPLLIVHLVVYKNFQVFGTSPLLRFAFLLCFRLFPVGSTTHAYGYFFHIQLVFTYILAAALNK